MADIQCVFESMSGKGSIYISNYQAARDLKVLQALNIQAIISVARSGLLSHAKEDIPHYLYIPAEDHKDYDIFRHFNQTFDFIEQARKETNVLVHCMAGVSRSVTIAMAYLLKKYKISLSQVISMTQRRRKKINPNKGFIEQLKKYAQEEGLKCDFDGNEVPNIKQRSCSNHRRICSVSVEGKPQKKYELSNPLQPIGVFKQFQEAIHKTAQTKEDSRSIKREEIKHSFEQFENKSGSHEAKSDLHEPALKKYFSYEKKQGDKRISIQDKINLIRQKIKRDDGRSPRNRKINWLQPSTQSKRQPKKQINNLQQNTQANSYAHLFSKNCKISKLIQQQKKQTFEESRDLSPAFNNNALGNQLYLKSQTLYERVKNTKGKKNLQKYNI